jgi:hypothetical protein
VSAPGHREIVALYNRLEAEAGGVAKADIKAVCRAAAEQLGLTYEDVREALLVEWTTGASG